MADVVVKKLAELEASRAMLEQYRQSVEVSACTADGQTEMLTQTKCV